MEFRWPVRVYYEDTDAGGVVYHASYVAYYERARTEMLRVLHFTQRNLLQQQIGFVVRRMTLDYKMAARLDELLEITSKVIKMSNTSLTFHQNITNQQGTVINEAEVLVVCVNTELMKPVALPPSIVTEFK